MLPRGTGVSELEEHLMSEENRQPTNARLGEIDERTREVAQEAREAPKARGEGGLESGRAEDAITRDVYDDASGALERSQRLRAADDARTDERQEELARMEAEAAEALRRNAETLRRTAEGLAETRERMREVAANTRELAADVQATRQDTTKVGEAVRATPPVVDPPVIDPAAGGQR
jgi:hypothetical protein